MRGPPTNFSKNSRQKISVRKLVSIRVKNSRQEKSFRKIRIQKPASKKFVSKKVHINKIRVKKLASKIRLKKKSGQKFALRKFV